MLYHKNHSSFLFILLVIIGISLLTSCSGGNSDNASKTTSTSAPPRGRTGVIDTGKTVALTTQQAGTDGTVITVQKPGDPLDGLEIMVPPQAYTGNKEFRISAAPITKHTFGDDFIAASPMITIDNGGGYSDQLISVKVPVKIPDGYFAMGFLYDSLTRQLEGMPLLETDADSITVGTRHFGDFLIGMINQVKIKDDVDSGFQPGIDDWQFTNRGSYIITNGHCEGQSMSAMWYYYTKPDGENAHLYNLYDNNGKKPATPDLWQDDSFGYRFCSVIQKDIDTGSYAYNFWPGIAGRAWKFVNNEWQWVTVPKLISDKTTRDLFAFAMQMTGEPQQVGMQSDAGGGHSMICYKVSKDTLYVADPNYPGITDRKIELINDTFKPYDSGDNKDDMDNGNTKNYEHIYYKAKSTIADWIKIAQRWTEFKKGTIGDDKFPAYQIVYVDEKGQYQELKDGFVSTNKLISMGDPDHICSIYRDNAWLNPDANNNIELNPGKNLLGVYVYDDTSSDANKPDNKYIDFKYLNVIYEPKETTPPVTTTSSSTMPSTTSTATAAGGGWYLEGEPVIEKENAVNDEYHTYSLTATNGSASGVYTWSDGECGGTYTGSMTWTPPPAYMQPGSVINFSMTSNTAVQNTCGSRSVGSGGWIKAEGTTIVKALDETSPSASGTYTVPDGRAGQKLQMWATIGVANLHVTVYYNYVYQSTGTTAR